MRLYIIFINTISNINKWNLIIDIATIIIAVMSLIIAVTTICVVINQLKRRNACLKIIVTPDSNFIWTTDVKTEEYGCFYKWMRISNASENPISIYEFYMKPKSRGKSDFISHSFIGPIKSKFLPKKSILKPIIHLKPYETIEGYVFFRGIYDVPSEEIQYIIHIKTPQRIFKKKFFVDYTERDL